MNNDIHRFKTLPPKWSWMWTRILDRKYFKVRSNSSALSDPLQQFGGDWTNRKLTSVREYLIAYQSALKNQPFTRYYIDAFAGTGYNTPKADDDRTSPLFAELIAAETRQFVDGSARIALQIPEPFDHYIFIERNPERHSELSKLKVKFPQLADRIEPINQEFQAEIAATGRSLSFPQSLELSPR